MSTHARSQSQCSDGLLFSCRKNSVVSAPSGHMAGKDQRGRLLGMGGGISSAASEIGRRSVRRKRGEDLGVVGAQAPSRTNMKRPSAAHPWGGCIPGTATGVGEVVHLLGPVDELLPNPRLLTTS